MRNDAPFVSSPGTEIAAAALALEPATNWLGSAEVAGMRAVIRGYTRIAPVEQIWTAPTNLLSFQYKSGGKLLSRQVSKRPSEYAPSGPLMFRGRSAVWQTKRDGSPQIVLTAYLDTPLFDPAKFEARFCSIDDFSMVEIMRMLYDEVRNPGFASEQLLESISEMLQIKLLRMMNKRDGEALDVDDAPPEATALGKAEIECIHEYVSCQRGSPPTVKELAQLLSMSRRSLLRRFKTATSMTVADYIAQVQLAKAKTLLATSDMILKEVAYETGFKHASNFTLAFKRATGRTPTEFRTHCRR